MDSITIHNIDDHLKRRLERQAAKHGVSVEEEALRVLAAALPYHENPPEGLGTAIHNFFKPVALTDEEYAIFTSAFEHSEDGTCSCHSESASSNPC